MAFNLTTNIRKYLSEKHSVPLTLDDDTAQTSVANLIVSGNLDLDEFRGLLASEHKKAKAKARNTIKSLLAEDPSDDELAAHEIAIIKKWQPERYEAEYGHLNQKEGSDDMTTSSDFLKMAVADHYGESPETTAEQSHVRVKGAGEQYSTRRAVLKHAKTGQEVHPILNGSKSLTPVESLSEWEHAKLGAFLKFKAAKAGFASLDEHDRSVLHEAMQKDTWIGYQGDTLVKRKNVKALIDDSTSGGENLVPEYFDTRIVSFPLLHSEILPHVDIVDIPRGSTAETASIGNPSVVWGTADASAQALFNTANLVAAISATIHPMAVFLQIGRDLMADSLAMIGKQLVENTAQAFANDLDRVILVGDGTSQPQGILTASGTVDITPTTPTTGAITIDDLLSLMFGISKALRTPSMNPRYAMADSRYKSHRAIATGVTGDDRLLHGMSVQSYSLLESPVSIENNGLTNADGVFGAFSRYRLWRRSGLQTGFESGGDTLVRSNSVLFHARQRFGGKIVDPDAFAIIDSWPTTA